MTYESSVLGDYLRRIYRGGGALALTGCMGDGNPTLIPNSNASLRKSSAEFAADAAKRTYEADAPKSNVTIARAEYSLLEGQFDMANLTNWDWKDVEVWVNQKYVVSLPQLTKNSGVALNFQLFYDSDGHHFDTHWGGNPVKSLQIYCGWEDVRCGGDAAITVGRDPVERWSGGAYSGRLICSSRTRVSCSCCCRSF